MTNFKKILMNGFLCTITLGGVQIFATIDAHAAYSRCGGPHQKICKKTIANPLQKACHKGLLRVGKFCRPCGGLNQRACAIFAKGGRCQSGLKVKKNICIRKVVGGNQKFARILQKAKSDVQRYKRLIRDLSSIARDFSRNYSPRRFKAILKSRDPGRIQQLLLQDLQRRAIFRILRELGFKTMTMGVESAFAAVGGYARETGVAMDTYERRRAKLFVSKTKFGGLIGTVGNNLVFSAYRSYNNQISGDSYAAIGDFDVGTGVGIVLWYNTRTLHITGISVGIGIGSLGAGGAVGKGTTYICPHRACTRI